MSKSQLYQIALSDSFLEGDSALSYVEALYETYLSKPDFINGSWKHFFDSLPSLNRPISLSKLREEFIKLAQQSKEYSVKSYSEASFLLEQEKLDQWVNAYRALGHKIAKTDPLNLKKNFELPELELTHYGLRAESDQYFTTSIKKLPQAVLRDIKVYLDKTYCQGFSCESAYISDTAERHWIIEQFEIVQAHVFSIETKKEIVKHLTRSESLERALATQFVGQKRFSIEGADALIPMLNHLIAHSVSKSIQEIVIGMSHRGRLNVLVNVLGKPPKELFEQFLGKHVKAGSGDVKYHDGYSSKIKIDNKIISLHCLFNPSHLEIISPVLEGLVYAKQQAHGSDEVLPLLLHGDASFSGQGVVMETFSLSQLTGYKTGGTIHIVINNQVGFTTDPQEGRSTLYCTDIAKMFEIPVFHVNGHDPEAALKAMELALAYRMKYKKDCIVELVCYRRHGHNESDEPSATQPEMYQVIKSLPTPRTLYAKELIQQNILTLQEEQQWQDEYRASLDQGDPIVETVDSSPSFMASWKPHADQSLLNPVKTGIDVNLLKKIGEKWLELPSDFYLQAQVKKIIEDRKKMLIGEQPLDWGCAELLAYATLLASGHSIRLSGQDSQRGTFAHRHAILHDIKTGQIYNPLAQFQSASVTCEILNSPLSEAAVMGFDYGYATYSPDHLTIWEAQFGDFANGAQVIIDQFLSAAEQKWQSLCNLVLFLPHGYEGQGPEHSSARLERYLQLCAEENLIVAVPTTPAQIFHLLRRQVTGPARKPLVVMTPKSLLRHKLAISSIEELGEGQFNWLISESDAIDPLSVKRVIFCTGKIYYDLLQRRREQKLNHIAIIRIEQLYPFPEQEVKAVLKRYGLIKEVVWCQEEPKNQGAWSYVQSYFYSCIEGDLKKLQYIGRPPSASTACGYWDQHVKELGILLDSAIHIF